MKVKEFDRDGKLYLVRWTLFSCRWFSIKLHKTVASDPADLHDHPWSYVSIMLWGGYYEWTSFEAPIYDSRNRVLGYRTRYTKNWYGPGSILIRKANVPHKLQIPQGKFSLTLIFTSKKKREWGFHTKDGFKPFEEKIAQEHGY